MMANGRTKLPDFHGNQQAFSVGCDMQRAKDVCKFGESLKNRKYEELLDCVYFEPFSVETLSHLGPAAKNAIRKISQLIKGVIEGDLKVKSFITQNIGLAVQMGNAALVLETLPCQNGIEDFFCFTFIVKFYYC